jgi:hypothetical protein
MNTNFDFHTYFNSFPSQVINQLGDRIDKAIDIVNTNFMIFPTEDENIFKVRSSTFRKPDSLAVIYSVHTDQKSCSCEDSRKGNICKHRIAVWLFLQHVKSGNLGKEVTQLVIRDKDTFRIFATHVPTGKRVQIIDWLKIHNQDLDKDFVYCTCKYANAIDGDRVLINVPRTDLIKLFFSN